MAIVAKPPEEFQERELEQLLKLDHSANWDEMGCKKTSTGLWMIERKAAEKGITNPKVLIVTTRSGKGTFFQLAPILLPKWQLYNADLKGISTFVKGAQIPLPLEFLGDTFTMPIIVVSHYHVFLKANKGIPVVHQDGPEKGYPKTDDNGGIIWMPLTQADYLMDINWDFVWVDEAHRIKERKNRWTKNLKKTKRTHTHVSTGTGFINRPQEVWSLLNMIDRKRFNNYWKFVSDYCLEEITESGFRKVVGIKPEKKDEFRALIREFGPRNFLQGVKEVLPIRIDVELNPTQRKMYNEIMKELETIDQRGNAIAIPTLLSMLTRLRQVAVATPEIVSQEFDPYTQKYKQVIRLVEPSSKLDAVMEVLEGLSWDDENRQQVVVFSNFKDPLDLLQARLDKAEIPWLRLNTEDNDDVRYQKWGVLWPEKKHQVFLSTVALGGESINLTSAQHLIFLDRSWSPKDNLQAIGRVRRPGQEGQPVVINIEAENTTDQYVESVTLRKEGWFNQIFGGGE